VTRRSCNGDGLLAAFAAAVANLEAHVDEINDLNVFPVPDGDTGSNMVATVRVALDEAQRSTGRSADRVAAAISFGALMGARGNSGVITSQILNGMARAIAGKKRINGLDLAHALALGTETAYAAVKKPVEGTILTVIREAAAAAKLAAEKDDDIETVLAATVNAADKAVASTPSLLPILREAGVVDSGGQGLYRLFQGALLSMVAGHQVGAVPAGTRAGARPSTLVAHADEGFGYETMFLLQPSPGRSLDIDVIRDRLESMGNSVVVAGDARAVKVHVHNERPDEIISLGLSLGNLSRITVENLDDQARDVREVRATEFTAAPELEAEVVGRPMVAGQGGTLVAAPNGSASRTRGRRANRANGNRTNGKSATGNRSNSDVASRAGGRNGTDTQTGRTTFAPGVRNGRKLPLAVVAVASGEGLARIFDDFGVAAIVRGGQAANPSTGELLAAVDAINADEILLLSNNPNVVLAARQVAELAKRPVHVIPTRNAAEGFAALLALDPGESAADNVADMTDRGRDLATLQVTTAVRDAKVGGRTVRKGQTIVLDPDDGLVASHNDRERAIMAALATLPAGVELMTLFYGDGADLAEAQALSQRISTARPGVEVEVRHGGQPHYRYLISAE
jgi:dihydroxyacetone kinase-like predicted kinase